MTAKPVDSSAETIVDSNDMRILGTVADFSLTDQSGTEFCLADFRGKVWIGNFIFTRCRATCPRQTAMLAQMQSEFASLPKWSDVRFASFSVDPEFDTPAVLTDYAKNYDADFDHWKFLTGPRNAIWDLSKDGFKLPVGEAPETTDMPIFHSPQFILVDRIGQIRGYYDSSDEADLRKLKRHLEIVLNEPADLIIIESVNR